LPRSEFITCDNACWSRARYNAYRRAMRRCSLFLTLFTAIHHRRLITIHGAVTIHSHLTSSRSCRLHRETSVLGGLCPYQQRTQTFSPNFVPDPFLTSSGRAGTHHRARMRRSVRSGGSLSPLTWENAFHLAGTCPRSRVAGRAVREGHASSPAALRHGVTHLPLRVDSTYRDHGK